MKSDYDYQFPWRPIFELTAIVGWIGGAVLSLSDQPLVRFAA